MNGIQFYLTEDVRLAQGHVIYVDSPWALTSVSQPQFWKRFDLTEYGDGTIKGHALGGHLRLGRRGMNGKEARTALGEEIATRDLGAAEAEPERRAATILRDDQLHSWFLDPDIEADADPSRPPRLETNAEPLLVNYVDTWRLRPEAVTRIPNFFLASRLRPYVHRPGHDGGGERGRAARRQRHHPRGPGSDATPCELWNLHEPEVFLPLRAYDRIRYRKGLPWDGPRHVARAICAGSVGRNTGAPRTAGGRKVRSCGRAERSVRRPGAAPEPPRSRARRPARATRRRGADQRATRRGGRRRRPSDAAGVAARRSASSDGGLRRLRIGRLMMPAGSPHSPARRVRSAARRRTAISFAPARRRRFPTASRDVTSTISSASHCLARGQGDPPGALHGDLPRLRRT